MFMYFLSFFFYFGKKEKKITGVITCHKTCDRSKPVLDMKSVKPTQHRWTLLPPCAQEAELKHVENGAL